MLDLNDLVVDMTGWLWLYEAWDISDTGYITGRGITSSGAFHAFLLTEIPAGFDMADGTDPAPEVVLDQDALNGGGLSVDLPETTTGGTFSASFQELSVGAVDFDNIDFFIPGPTFQLWELELTGEIIDEMIELVFNYNDNGMSLAQELNLDIYHSIGGQWIPLGGTVDTVANTIIAYTDSLSPFALGATGSGSGTAPAPGTMLLFGFGGAGLAWRRRRSRG